MGSYLQERGPFLSGENYSLDRCPLMGGYTFMTLFIIIRCAHLSRLGETYETVTGQKSLTL